MSCERIQVMPLSPLIGAEISGVDLSEPLGNQEFQEIHDALITHQVIFFREQTMTLNIYTTSLEYTQLVARI